MKRYLDSSFENEFEYKGKKYRAVEKKRGDKHCSFLCAFGEHNCYGIRASDLSRDFKERWKKCIFCRGEK